jgi:hypothetical protein
MQNDIKNNAQNIPGHPRFFLLDDSDRDKEQKQKEEKTFCLQNEAVRPK